MASTKLAEAHAAAETATKSAAFSAARPARIRDGAGAATTISAGSATPLMPVRTFSEEAATGIAAGVLCRGHGRDDQSLSTCRDRSARAATLARRTTMAEAAVAKAAAVVSIASTRAVAMAEEAAVGSAASAATCSAAGSATTSYAVADTATIVKASEETVRLGPEPTGDVLTGVVAVRNRRGVIGAARVHIDSLDKARNGVKSLGSGGSRITQNKRQSASQPEGERHPSQFSGTHGHSLDFVRWSPPGVSVRDDASGRPRAPRQGSRHRFGVGPAISTREPLNEIHVPVQSA